MLKERTIHLWIKLIWLGQSRLKQEIVDRREGEAPTALNIESSQNDVGELAYFQARRIYITMNLHTAGVMNIFFTSLIKYAGITNIYARFTGKFVSREKSTARIFTRKADLEVKTY